MVERRQESLEGAATARGQLEPREAGRQKEPDLPQSAGRALPAFRTEEQIPLVGSSYCGDTSSSCRVGMCSSRRDHTVDASLSKNCHTCMEDDTLPSRHVTRNGRPKDRQQSQ